MARPPKLPLAPDAPRGEGYRAPALDKGLDIVELLSATDEGLAQADIAKALGRSANEIFRMLDRLVRRGYVRRSGDRYELTLKLFALAHQHAPMRRLVALATPVLRELSRRAQQSCHLAIFDRGHVVVVAQQESPTYYGLSIRVGARIGLFNTGSGHVLLAFTSERERERMIREHELVPGEAAASDDLAERLRLVRQHGYEQMESMQVRGVVNLSAPVVGPNGQAIAVLTLPYVTPVESGFPDVQAALGLVRAAAAELTQSCGGRPRLVDTHCHLIYRSRLDYPWLQQVPPLNRDFVFEDYLVQARAAGVSDIVYMEADVEESQMEAEAAFAASLGNDIVGVVAACRPESRDFPAYLDRIVANPKLRGLRRVLHTQPDELAAAPAFAAHLRRVAEHRLSFDLCLRADQLAIGTALARACPDVTFVLDHCGNPRLPQPGPAWRSALRRLAELPNTVCKLSGLITRALPEGWTVEGLRPAIEHAIDSFGWDRVVWGSDWPVCTPAGTLAAWLEATQTVIAQASPAEAQQLFSRNAERIYRLT